VRPRVAIFAAALAAALAATPLAAQTPPFFFWLTPQTKPPAPAASPMPAPKPTAPAPEPTSTQAAKPPPWVETPAPEPPPPYEPQLLRLAEIIGALSYLRDLCGAGDGATFRAKFASLLETEGNTPARKETLAGAFNRGLRDYELTYRACTPAAREIVARFLDEAARIAKDVAARWAG
jgi:uncharacterized protein (TIGR02301 family)